MLDITRFIYRNMWLGDFLSRKCNHEIPAMNENMLELSLPAM